MSVTPEDRIAAASVAVLPEMRELILAGKADHHAEPWAACREKAFLAGARAMQSKAADIANSWFQSDFDESANCAAQNIRDEITELDPAILKEQGE